MYTHTCIYIYVYMRNYLCIDLYIAFLYHIFISIYSFMVYIQSQGSRMIKAEGSTESTMALPHWCSPSINTSLGYIGPDPTYFRV